MLIILFSIILCIGVLMLAFFILVELNSVQKHVEEIFSSIEKHYNVADAAE